MAKTYRDPHDPTRVITVKAIHREIGTDPDTSPAVQPQHVPSLLEANGCGVASIADQFCGVIAAYCYEADKLRDNREWPYSRVSGAELNRVMGLRKVEA